jgi:hypothetical protein
MLVLAGTFIGWIAISLLVDRIRGARERISDLLIEATIFTAVMTVIDYLTLMAMRRDRG